MSPSTPHPARRLTRRLVLVPALIVTAMLLAIPAASAQPGVPSGPITSAAPPALLAPGAPPTASAQPNPPDIFSTCWYDLPCDTYDGTTAGIITWNNRTATVTGYVTDPSNGSDRWTVVLFEAYAGRTKVDSQSRSANLEGSIGSPRGFEFIIGDPNLRGGIDRIKITPCFDGMPYGRLDCVAPSHYTR